MENTLCWGILGASKFALEHMLPAMQLAKRTKCVALATSKYNHAKPFLSINPEIAVHKCYELLLQDTNIDATYITHAKLSTCVLDYRPPAPEAIVPMDQRPIMHCLSNWTTRVGLLTVALVFLS